MASTEQDRNLKEFVLHVPEKLLRCRDLTSTPTATFGSTRASEKAEHTSMF
jgi:hypothetical protein